LDFVYRKRTWFQELCLWFMTSLGWKMHTDLPEHKKYIVIAAPHTSNWDFILGMFGMKAIGLPLRWVGKHTIFRPPFGWFFRYVLGGIPVDRRARHDFVQQVIELYDRHDEMVLVMAPEGTRGATTYWKTGFYWIAHGAGIPIVLGFIDWGRLEGGVGPLLWPSGDIDADFEVIQEFYADKTGKHPDKKSDIRLARR
jgi:1-acyl-sn-glycerol-3-phosphate acyltransferase